MIYVTPQERLHSRLTSDLIVFADEDKELQ